MSPGATIRLLMVEDSPDDALFIREMLAGARACRFEVHHVVRLTDGLTWLADQPVDAVLLDFSLPDCRGLDTYRRVRATQPEVPVVILTHQDDETMAVQAVREGAQDYLVKGEVEAARLERALRYAIERQRARHELRVSEERYALAMRGANDGLWDWNLETDEVYFTSRWREMLGLTQEETIGTIDDWLGRVHPDDLPAIRHALDTHLTGRTKHFQHEHRIRNRAGSYLWVLSRGLAVSNGAGEHAGPDDAPLVSRMAGSMTDITARKCAEERLVHDALHDSLTALPNRALFFDRMEQAHARARGRGSKQFAVLFLDLDRFKNVNDSLGHAVGDELLVAITQRLRILLRRGDTLARIGGDEFAVLVNEVSGVTSATHVAGRIQDQLRQPFSVGGQEVYTSASIGIALSSTGYEEPADLLRDADIAMYRAKGEGGGRSAVFDRNMHQRAVALLKLETELRRAVENEEFLLHYQPIVSMESGVPVGFEALIRWNHPDGHIVPPDEFIPIAEETGLIVPIGWWTLREACLRMKEWSAHFPDQPPLSISVNFSGKLFAQTAMADQVQKVLAETGLEPSRLRLEVTENVVMEYGEALLAQLDQLRATGIQLSIDDFGTGYSSLNCLQRFRDDSLKIDKSFVTELGNDAEARAIVGTILALGNHLGMNVIAEGVETEAQASQLRAMHCQQGQGFWFGVPKDNAATVALLSEQA